VVYARRPSSGFYCALRELEELELPEGLAERLMRDAQKYFHVRCLGQCVGRRYRSRH